MLDLTGSALLIEDRGLRAGRQVRWSRRIGITVGVEPEWRCVDPASKATSRTVSIV
jgi:3-methyladenine DNA glycosylase Mpg